MPSWKKVITSGSNAVLNQITASAGISTSGDIDLSGGDIWIGGSSRDSFCAGASLGTSGCGT